MRVRILLPLPKGKPCAPTGARLFLCLFWADYPLIDPLQIRNTLYVPLHTGRAVLFHLLADVAVHVQCKGGGGVAQVTLHRFYAVPVLKRKDCEGVPLWHNKDKSENPCVAMG